MLNHLHCDKEFEELVGRLQDVSELDRYKRPFDNYPIGFVPRMLGALLVASGTILYGKEPSYLKFRAVEVIARVPYQSWKSVMFAIQTLCYKDEKRVLALANVFGFARMAQENETMHVVVISKMAAEEEKSGFIRDTLLPLLFALFYYFASYILFLVKPKWSLELNYAFEQHAFDQYDRFLKQNEQDLKRKRVDSAYLHWYGRHPRNQYEFFASVRNDEIIHRNRSIEYIQLLKG